MLGLFLTPDFARYLVSGASATAVNMGSYALLTRLGLGNVPSTAVSWFLAVLTAYFLNRHFVFRVAKTGRAMPFWREMGAFCAARGGTGLMDVLFMFVTVDLLSLHPTWMKFVSNLIVGVVNYLVGKLVIFRRKREG